MTAVDREKGGNQVRTPEQVGQSYSAGWVVTANCLALLAFVASPGALDLPAGAASIAAFIIVPLLWPQCRPNAFNLLCPANVALLVFWWQLVLNPLLIGFFGFSSGSLPALPSVAAINSALVLNVVGYAAFCISYSYVRTPGRAGELAHHPVTDPCLAGGGEGMSLLVVLYAALGLLGLFLAFPSIHAFIDFVTDPALQRAYETQPTTLGTAAANFLRPFLGFALVLAWSLWLSRRRATVPGPAFALVTVGLILCLVVVNFRYNRGSIAAPLIALAAAYSAHVRRLSLPVVTLASGGLLFVALVFGSYRASTVPMSEFLASDAEPAVAAGVSGAPELLQVYGSAPQFSAFLMERNESELSWGRTVLSSALYPVPVVGKPFRETSGVTVYNMLIYGTPEILDQVVPYEAEFFLDFHIPGVIIGYALLGIVFGHFQRRFETAPHAIETYSWLIMSVWLIFPGSVPVASQIYVYFLWPIYGYMALKRLYQPVPASRAPATA